MPARTWLNLRTSKAALLITLVLFAFSGCKSTNDAKFATYGDSPSKPPPEQASKPKPVDKDPVKYSPTFDAEIKAIMDDASHNRWEAAQQKADVVHQQDPTNPMVERVYSWVRQQQQKSHEQALEDKIRDIESKNSVFSPTIKSLLTENRDRGLPPRKDIRDAVDRIENTPWIPDTYGKTHYEKGPLFDFESTKGRMVKMLDKEVTIHLDNVPLETMLINLSQTAGVNIVADKALPAIVAARAYWRSSGTAMPGPAPGR